jgi:protoporphyrinogen oxidase
MTASGRVVVIGAGPAGLSAAHELTSRGVPVAVVEREDRVGGIARTVTHDGYRLDIGGHRFLTKVPEVERLWATVMGDQFLTVRRLSRIFYRNRFFDYPIRIPNVVRNLGARESLLVLGSYLRAQVRRGAKPATFEQWVTSRFGSRLYRTFFAVYTEKVWGIPGSEIRADWASQRIKGLSVRTALRQALVGDSHVASLATEFRYPRLGVGQMWERVADRVTAAGGAIHLGCRVARVRHDGRRVAGVEIEDSIGARTAVNAVDHVISSAALVSLLERFDPLPPADVLAAARGLRYRDFIMVGLILDDPSAFPDNWIYVHSPEVHVGRIQNFRNWSPAMVPDPRRTSLGMEYFASKGDRLWGMSDDALQALAVRELEQLGLGTSAQVAGGCVVRQRRAYPVYDDSYRDHVRTIRDYLARFSNLQTIGRNGTHRYNNQDHSTLAGLMAARNILGERHDVWSINTDGSYLES